MTIDRNAAIQFLQTAFRPDDWIAVLLKAHQGSRVAQRVVPVSLAVSTRIQDWMERANQAGHSVYVSVNAVAPMQTSRWGYVQGLTRLSQRTPWQDGRFTLDRAASRLLTSVQ